MGTLEEKVVCLEGQREVAAIALRAPCSGIQIQDDKQTVAAAGIAVKPNLKRDAQARR